jgi:hypothetical protein
VTRVDESPLHVESTVAEVRLRLRRGCPERALELLGRSHEAHALATTSRRSLQKQGKTDVAREGLGLGERCLAVGARDERQPGGTHRLLRLHLVAHRLDRLRPRPDKGEVVVLAGAGELGVLGEEAPAGVDSLAPRRRRGSHERRNVQIAERRRWWPDLDGLVGERDVERVSVGGRVHGDGVDAELPAGADDPNCSFAAVGDQDAPEHRVASDP